MRLQRHQCHLQMLDCTEHSYQSLPLGACAVGLSCSAQARGGQFIISLFKILSPQALGFYGNGYTGSDCSVACQPCYNGTCNRAPTTAGECICNPGFVDDACLLECGSFGKSNKTGVVIGSRGLVNVSATSPGNGLNGSTALCQCDGPGQPADSPNGWTGPLCTVECPYPYDTRHGICVVKNVSEAGPEEARVVCFANWTGLPAVGAIQSPWMPNEYGEPIPGLPQGRNCSIPCATCGKGSCQLEGECLCKCVCMASRGGCSKPHSSRHSAVVPHSRGGCSPAPLPGLSDGCPRTGTVTSGKGRSAPPP